jgi:ABC-type amino acid transport substrate-binding protein
MLGRILAALLVAMASAPGVTSQMLAIGFADGYPPYQFIDAAGKPAGLDIDIARALASEMGVGTRIVQGPWDDMVNLLRRSLDLDVVGGMEESEERAKLFDFSAAVYLRKNMIVVLATNRDIRGIKDLNGRTISGDRGSYGEALIARNGDTDKVRIAASKSKEEAMTMLKTGRVEASLMPDAVAVDLARKAGVAIRLVDIGDPGSPVAFAVPRGNQTWLPRLDAALLRLKAGGKIQAILAKWLE